MSCTLGDVDFILRNIKRPEVSPSQGLSVLHQAGPGLSLTAGWAQKPLGPLIWVYRIIKTSLTEKKITKSQALQSISFSEKEFRTQSISWYLSQLLLAQLPLRKAAQDTLTKQDNGSLLHDFSLYRQICTQWNPNAHTTQDRLFPESLVAFCVVLFFTWKACYWVDYAHHVRTSTAVVGGRGTTHTGDGNTQKHLGVSWGQNVPGEPPGARATELSHRVLQTLCPILSQLVLDRQALQNPNVKPD